MKKNWKRLTAITMAGIMECTAAGCGSGSSGESQSTGAAGGTQAQTTAAAGSETTQAAGGAPSSGSGENVTIKITWWGGQGRHDYTQKLLDAYTELHPNVTFEAMPAGWDGYFEKLSTQAASGSMPDIVQMDYLYITTYAKNGSLADLQPYMDNGTIDVSNVDPNLLNTGKIDGKMVGAVLSTSALVTGYNPSVLAEANYAEPGTDWTWDDFKTMCQTVKDKTGKLGTAVGPVDDTNIFHYWVREHGESLFSEDKKSLGYKDDAICADYFDMWKELMDGGMAANPDEYAQIQTLGQEAGPVVTGDAASIFEWNNYTSKVAAVNDTLKMTTPPMLEGGSKGLWLKPGMFFSVAETSKVKDEAAAFIDWFINSEEANDIIMAERGTPVSSKIREYLVGTGTMSAQQQDMFDYVDAAAELSGSTPAPDPVGMSEVNEAFKNAAYSVFYGQATSAEAAAAFRAEADAILARNN